LSRPSPDEGENLRGAEAGSKDSVLNAALIQYTFPTGRDGETSVEFAINPPQLRGAFAADLPEQQTALMAATQRPVAAAAFSDASGPPAWRRLPSWAVVATGDRPPAPTSSARMPSGPAPTSSRSRAHR
jgi:hypothetical protein